MLRPRPLKNLLGMWEFFLVDGFCFYFWRFVFWYIFLVSCFLRKRQHLALSKACHFLMAFSPTPFYSFHFQAKVSLMGFSELERLVIDSCLSRLLRKTNSSNKNTLLICLKIKTILKKKEKKHFHRDMLLLKVGVVSFKQGRLFWKYGDWLRNATLLGDPTPLDKHPSLSVLLLEWAPHLKLACGGENHWLHLTSQTCMQSQVCSRTLHLWDFKQNSGSNYFC